MISVCMGIYNGEKYIEEQLLSILHQTLPPQEVILSDDGSTDSTREIVQKFIEEYHLAPGWKLYCNEKNKGYPGNFYYSMSLCHGDIVFLADQDDIWDIHKLEYMVSIMKRETEAKAVCCKFGLIDAEGSEIHTLMAPVKSKGTGNVRNVSIEGVFYKCEWPGMVVAYERNWYQEKFCRWLERRKNAKGSYPDIPHDFLVCAWAAEDDVFFQLDEELAWHRRHGHNAGGEEHRLKKLLSRERKLKEIEDYNRILRAFSYLNIMETRKGAEALQTKYTIMQERYDALASGKICKVMQNAWKNRNSIRLMTVICDIIIVIKK